MRAAEDVLHDRDGVHACIDRAGFPVRAVEIPGAAAAVIGNDRYGDAHGNVPCAALIADREHAVGDHGVRRVVQTVVGVDVQVRIAVLCMCGRGQRADEQRCHKHHQQRKNEPLVQLFRFLHCFFLRFKKFILVRERDSLRIVHIFNAIIRTSHARVNNANHKILHFGIKFIAKKTKNI